MKFYHTPPRNDNSIPRDAGARFLVEADGGKRFFYCSETAF